jgi:hypothetical protein
MGQERQERRPAINSAAPAEELDAPLATTDLCLRAPSDGPERWRLRRCRRYRLGEWSHDNRIALGDSRTKLIVRQRPGPLQRRNRIS